MSRKAAEFARNRRGFTLAEFLMAVLMFLFILMGLASIYGAAIRFQSVDYRKGLLEDYAVVIQKRLASEVERAVRVQNPSDPPGPPNTTPSSSPALEAGVLSDTGNPPGPDGWFVFCRDASDNLRYYSGSGAAAPGINCGVTGGSELISSHVTSLNFTRSAEVPGVLDVNLEMTRRDQKLRVRTQIPMLQSSSY